MKVWPPISRKWLLQTNQNSLCAWHPLGGGQLATMQKSRAFMKGSWNYICMCENSVLVLPVNILTVWCTGILGSTTHYRVSWYACLYKQVIATDYGGYPVYTPSHILHQTSDHLLNDMYSYIAIIGTNEIRNVCRNGSDEWQWWMWAAYINNQYWWYLSLVICQTLVECI